MKLFLRNFFSLFITYMVMNVILYYMVAIQPIPEESLDLLIKAQTGVGLFMAVLLASLITSHGRKFI